MIVLRNLPLPQGVPTVVSDLDRAYAFTLMHDVERTVNVLRTSEETSTYDWKVLKNRFLSVKAYISALIANDDALRTLNDLDRIRMIVSNIVRRHPDSHHFEKVEGAIRESLMDIELDLSSNPFGSVGSYAGYFAELWEPDVSAVVSEHVDLN